MTRNAGLSAASWLAAALGVDIVRLTAIGGGDINHAARVETGDRTYFVKWNDHDLPGHFEAEAAGLAAMKGGDLVIPDVIGWSDAQGKAFLALEYLEPGPRMAGFDESLGRGLAQLHRRASERFGFHLDGYCGSTPQPNPWTEDWVSFYARHRLGHQLSLAARNGLDSRIVAAGEALCARLGDLLDPGEPALIHTVRGVGYMLQAK